ncbi:hypothetical protein OPQ81_006317 [Rhizoctonia solani]|nr:hypothetical protein OPQ81_006317 [Rhizoctonia solani]
MPSRHGSVQSLNSPPTHSLLYTMSDLDLPPSQHPSLANINMNMDRYDIYDVPPPTSHGETSSVGGMGPARPKRKQVKNACSACQRACKRCDVGRPCERCIKYGMAETCRDSQRKERKKGIKRGPYKKRDGMINDLQRMSPKRIPRVNSVGEVDLSSASLIPIDADPLPSHTQAQTLPLQIQSVPPARPVDAQYSYQTPVVIPASHSHTPPLSLAGMHQHQHQYQQQPVHPHQQQQHQQQHHHNSNPHPQPSSSYHHSEEQYYPTRYDHLPHAPARSSHFRTNDTCSQPSQHQDYSRHVQQVQDYSRSPMTGLQYTSPDRSPPRERQYPNAVYQDNSSRHSMAQPVHHDPSYQSQSDSLAHDHESHDTRVMDSYYVHHQHQQHQRPYSSDGHMPDVHQQQDHQQQQSYYPNYNAYSQSTSYGSSHSQSHSQQQQHQQQYYSQNHVPQQQAMSQSQSDAGYPQHLNYASPGSSMNAYPAQPHHQMDNAGIQLQYPSTRSPMKMVHRGSFDATAGMVAHPHPHSHHPHHHHQQHHPQHVGNVQIQSN